MVEANAWTVWDVNEAMLFKTGDCPVEQLWKACDEEINSTIDKTVANLAKKQNASLRGLLHQVEGIDDIEGAWPDSVKAHPLHYNKEFRLFAVSVRVHTLRVGAASRPLLGTGCFILAGSQGVSLCGVDSSVLAEKCDFAVIDQSDAALETKQHKDHPWAMAYIEPGQAAWVPYGTIPLVTGVDDITSFCVFPWMSVAMYKVAKTRGEGAELLMEAVCKHARKHKDESAWKTLAEKLEGVIAESK